MIAFYSLTTDYRLLTTPYCLLPTAYSLLTTCLRGQMVGEGRSVEATGETYEGEFSGHRKLLAPAWGPSYGQVTIGSNE